MKSILLVVLALTLSGCATWSTSTVDRTAAVSTTQQVRQNKPPEEVMITERDVEGRKYESLGDISVTVNKTTVFHPDPTPEMVNQKLQEKAASLGADAVIFVRHGSGGVSFFSWGSLEGKGRAIRYID